eukprot:CAMPEP_0183772258 /NCGR_PEP_ID=MMETSP0739-20130205/35448_1 /TAXON_ID=385413 /ORGANISM="Thalassiosira miniscula, Strain CCMP1093" /LENGTH=49 /DNA_ID= /DNA_START= /DNA_END= /DNA_ORIENTATION=
MIVTKKHANTAAIMPMIAPMDRGWGWIVSLGGVMLLSGFFVGDGVGGGG